MIRGLYAIVLAAALAGCIGPSPAEPPATPPTQAPGAPTVEPEPACLTVSATWVDHFQEFMEDGYTVIRGAGVASGGRFFSVAVLYTSPAGEEILGTWGAGEDPSSETVSMVFPLDDVTASHTVVTMPIPSVVAEAGAGSADAVTCLG